MGKLLRVMASVLVTATVAGCGSDEPAGAPAPTSTASPEPSAQPHGFEPGHSQAVRDYYGTPHVHDEDELGDSEADYHEPPRPASGAIGDTIVLTGTNLGVRMRVKVNGLVDPVTDASRPAGGGRRYVAVRLGLRNTGIAVFESLLEDAYVTFGDERRARVARGVRSGCSNGFQSDLRIDVSRRARGCILFAVPEGDEPDSLQLALEQVPAEAGGRWSLR